MATFFENLRTANKLPSWTAEPLKEDTLDENIDLLNFHARRATEGRQAKNEAIKQTAPLREKIKEVSGGKVSVDDTIYNEKELRRILNTVQKMKSYNNGVLFPGYTVISNSFKDTEDDGQFLYGDYKNIYGLAPFPNGLYGTKNNPYKIYIKHANAPDWNDYRNADSIKSEWHPKTGEENQSSTHTHELSHSAHKEALKKSHPPTLWMSPEEDEAYKNLISKFSSFRDLVQKLTDKYHLENTKNAAKSVSGYAEYAHDEDEADKAFPFHEMFAEAYSDVLSNGNSARPYSKALVEAYSEYLNEYNAIFDNDINRIRKQFNNNNFIKNLRNSSPKFNNNRYIKK